MVFTLSAILCGNVCFLSYCQVVVQLAARRVVGNFDLLEAKERGVRKSGVKLGHEQVAQHVLPCTAAQPSLTIIGTMSNPAAGSAHHQPKTAFNSSPHNRIAER